MLHHVIRIQCIVNYKCIDPHYVHIMEHNGHTSPSTPQIRSVVGDQLVGLVNPKHPMVIIIDDGGDGDLLHPLITSNLPNMILVSRILPRISPLPHNVLLPCVHSGDHVDNILSTHRHNLCP